MRGYTLKTDQRPLIIYGTEALPMPSSNFELPGLAGKIDQIVAWARQAGKIALNHFNNVDPRRKTDRTFLTQADLEIEDFLSRRIQAAFPDHSLIGEEKVQPQTGSPSAHIWTIDPIDGTTAFVQGLPGWGISVGLLYQGRPQVGLFYMPLLDDMTYTTGPGQVYGNGRNLSGAIRRDWGQKGFLAINATAHHDIQIDIKRTRALGSIGANLVYTARGAAAAAFVARACLWDLVAGAAILGAAGGELRYLSGRPIDYLELLDGRKTPEPVIAGHPQVLSQLTGAIRPRRSD